MAKPRLTIVRMGPREIGEQVNPNMFRDAYTRGMSVSALMERMNPTEPDDRSGLDAFGRVMKELGIITRSMPEAGIVADRWEDAFDETPQRRLLGLEWAARTWRRAALGRPTGSRQILTSQDYGAGSALRPYAEAADARVQQLSPAIPLAELIAVTTGIDTNLYRALYVEDVDPNAARMVRIGETAEIPRVTLKESARPITLYKYGRGIESSYEVLRRQRLDRVALIIGLLAIQAETDKVATALDVAVNGDGNAGTGAVVHNLTALDPTATAGNLTLTAWVAFKLKFANPYAITTALVREAVAQRLLLLNTGSANILLANVQAQAGLGGFTQINPGLRDNVALGWTDEAPANQIVGLDRRVALERVYEVGSEIREVEGWASRQTEALFLTEVEGYAVADKRGTKVLNLAA